MPRWFPLFLAGGVFVCATAFAGKGTPAFSKAEQIRQSLERTTIAKLDLRDDFPVHVQATRGYVVPGTFCVLTPKEKEAERPRLVEPALDVAHTAKEAPVPGPNERNVSPAQQLKKRMQGIVLPKVNFKNVPLKDAVKNLRELSVRFDLRSAPEDRGVTIAVTGPIPEHEATPPAAGSPAQTSPPASITPSLASHTNPSIHYEATNVSLLQAVEAVARLGHYYVHVQAYGVSLDRVRPQDVLVNAEYDVPPTGLPDFGLKPSLEEVAQKNASRHTDWLTTGGVIFDGGASAIYIVRSRRLIVRDSEARQNIIQEKSTLPGGIMTPPKRKGGRIGSGRRAVGVGCLTRWIAVNRAPGPRPPPPRFAWRGRQLASLLPRSKDSAAIDPRFDSET